MTYSDDSYAAMLLCLALSPNREEYARALNTAEYRELCTKVHNSSVRRLGGLLGLDIGKLMQVLDISEEEAFRLHTLMSRTVPLSYTMDGFIERGIQIITEHDEGYPIRLRKRAGTDAPPVFYIFGDCEDLNKPSIGIIGIPGIKTTNEVKAALENIAAFAKSAGYRIMSGGEFGVSRVMEGFITGGDSDLTAVLGGGLSEYIERPEIKQLYTENRITSVSLEHPDALFTNAHAIARNKMLMSLSEAVFIFNTDGKRGESDALRTKRSDWIYAWNDYPANAPLIKKGAVPIKTLEIKDLEDMSKRWKYSRSEQLNIFDMM